MRTLSKGSVAVNVYKWSHKYEYGYEIFGPDSAECMLFGLIHLKPKFHISLSSGELYNFKDINTISQGLKLVSEYFTKSTSNNRKKPMSLGQEMKRRVMDNSMRHSRNNK